MKIFESLKPYLKKAASFLVAIGISLGLLSSFAADTNISTRSLVVREGLRTVMNTIDPKGGGTLFSKLAGKITTTPSVYRPSKGYEYKKVQIENCTLEVLTKTESENKAKVIYQIHGGAFVFAMQDLYRWQAEKWSELCGGATVVMIDYRLAPDSVFPAAHDDVLDGWNWITQNGYEAKNIVVTGDSAGGNLALSLVLSLRDMKKELPAAVVTMSPWADLAAEGESYTANIYKDPMLGIKEGKELEIDIRNMGKIYAGDTDLHNSALSPAYAEYDGFCPTLIQVGTYEVLYSDSATVNEKMKKAGVDVTFSEYEGMWHVFQIFGSLIPEGEAAWNEAGAFASKNLYK